MNETNTEFARSLAKVMCDALIADGYDVVAVVLQGSQNYGLDTESSDYDFKAFVMPAPLDLYDSRRVSMIRQGLTGQCEVKDIRDLAYLLGKLNPTYLEILASPVYYVPDNPVYLQLWYTLRNMVNPLVHENREVTKMVTAAMIRQFTKAAGTSDVPDYKRLSHVYRLYTVWQKLTAGLDFTDTLMLTGDDLDHALAIKTGTIATNKLYDEIAIINVVVDTQQTFGLKIENTASLGRIQHLVMDAVYATVFIRPFV